MPIFVGVMTGTSIDGLDIAAIELEPDFKLIASSDISLPDDLRANIKRLARSARVDWQLLGQTDAQLGELIGDSVNRFLDDHAIAKDDVVALGSHGQTVHHSPDSDPAFTVQIGDASRISERTGITVVSDFRRADIAAGGQGAPLVPPFHQMLFGETDTNTAVCNIGGIANLTLLFADSQQALLGFDTGPGNTLLDAWCQRHRNESFDQNGEWAKTGSSHAQLLSALLGDPFVQRTPPKSTGVEHYNLTWLDELLTQQDLSQVAPEDVQATLAEFTARSLTAALRATSSSCSQLVLCGGGRRNTDLVERIKRHAPCVVHDCDALGVNGDALEAAAFAWLASQTMAGLPGNAPSVTGATKPMRLGSITTPL